jgi:uncharacterized membrane protein
MTLSGIMEDAAIAFEVVGAVILICGFFFATWLGFSALRSTKGVALACRVWRESFGNAILMALTALVAADLIRTVALEPTLLHVTILGILIFIRTFLSFSLDVEMEGVAPWRRARDGVGSVSPTVNSATADDPAIEVLGSATPHAVGQTTGEAQAASEVTQRQPVTIRVIT